MGSGWPHTPVIGDSPGSKPDTGRPVLRGVLLRSTDIMRLGLRPFVAQVQGVLQPAVFKHCERRAMGYISRVQRLLPILRGLLRGRCTYATLPTNY